MDDILGEHSTTLTGTETSKAGEELIDLLNRVVKNEPVMSELIEDRIASSVEENVLDPFIACSSGNPTVKQLVSLDVMSIENVSLSGETEKSDSLEGQLLVPHLNSPENSYRNSPIKENMLSNVTPTTSIDGSIFSKNSVPITTLAGIYGTANTTSLNNEQDTCQLANIKEEITQSVLKEVINDDVPTYHSVGDSSNKSPLNECNINESAAVKCNSSEFQASTTSKGRQQGQIATDTKTVSTPLIKKRKPRSQRVTLPSKKRRKGKYMDENVSCSEVDLDEPSVNTKSSSSYIDDHIHFLNDQSVSKNGTLESTPINMPKRQSKDNASTSSAKKAKKRRSALLVFPNKADNAVKEEASPLVSQKRYTPTRSCRSASARTSLDKQSLLPTIYLNKRQLMMFKKLC